MRVRVAGAHHGAAVLENLHPADRLDAAEFSALLDPNTHHPLDLFHRHAGERQIVARRKADHPAEAALGLCHDQSVSIDGDRAGGWLQRREIVGEDEYVRSSRG